MATAQKSSIRSQISDELRSIVPFDELEHTHLDGALTWVNSGAPLFRIEKPDNPPKHLVSYFLLYDPSAQELLLVDHINAGLWLPSGGHIEIDEHPQTTVIRECQEELGVDADFYLKNPLFITVTQTVNTDRPHTDVSLWYVLRGDQSMSFEWDRREFREVKWWSLKDILAHPAAMFDPHLQRFVEKLRSLPNGN